MEEAEAYSRIFNDWINYEGSGAWMEEEKVRGISIRGGNDSHKNTNAASIPCSQLLKWL